MQDPSRASVYALLKSLGVESLGEWAQSMGDDFRRAWDECPSPEWLMIYAARLGECGPVERQDELVRALLGAWGIDYEQVKRIARGEPEEVQLPSNLFARMMAREPEAMTWMAEVDLLGDHEGDPAQVLVNLREAVSIDELLEGAGLESP